MFFETPTNPTLDILEISVIVAQAQDVGALTVVDNTFATPVNQNPLSHGADLVIHSATKYLGGHSDLTAGALIGPSELLRPVAMWRKNLGQMIAPETASLFADPFARSRSESECKTTRRRLFLTSLPIIHEYDRSTTPASLPETPKGSLTPKCGAGAGLSAQF